MSSDLQWLLIRKYNSSMVKRVPEGPVFSKEPGNLMNLHSHKYSGYANEKTIHIGDTKDGLEIHTRKTKGSPHSVSSARGKSTIRARSGPRRAARVGAGPAKRGYRPDLRKASVARVSALLAAQREPKPAHEKKVRGSKAKAVEE